MLADEECVEGGQPFDVSAGMDSALGDFDDRVRNLFGETQRCFETDLEGAEIAVVYAHDFSAGSKRGVKFRAVVNFDERGHLEFRGEFAVAPQFRFVENGGDEENRVSSVGGGFNDVDFVDGEIFTQDRNR